MLNVGTATLLAGFLPSIATAQDECSTAVTAVVGANAFSTISATSSPEPVDESQCPATFLDWGTANKDVWFKYTSPADGVLSLDTCASGSFDTSMVLYTGTCSALTQIACNGDGTGLSACQNYYSRIEDAQVFAGMTYYIRIGGWTDSSGSAESGVGALSLSFFASNPGCVGASGSCGHVHPTGGCSDFDCCRLVCDFDPSCCDASWTSDCVSDAVELCGIFVHQCTSPSPTVANDCAPNATLLTSDTFRDINNTGCNTDGPDHPGNTCNSGNDVLLNDVWYRFEAVANGYMTVQTCVVDGGPATTYDTKLAIYDMGTSPATFDYDTLREAVIGCDDDGSGNSDCAAGGGVYPSYLSVPVDIGHSYLIRVGAYDSNTGSARVTFDFPEPCPLPAHTRVEAEACGADTNGGCNSGGPTEPIAIGARIKGSFWLDDDGQGNLTRDLDWYRLDLASDKEVTFDVYSAGFVFTALVAGDFTSPGCAGISLLGTGEDACPARITLCLNPGTYYFVVGLDFDGSKAPCGSGVFNDYLLEVTAVDAACPTVVGTTCDAPGADSAWSQNRAPPAGSGILGGVISCAANPAFPNCSQGGTTANTYARVFNAGQLGGEINCFEIGFYSVKRTTNSANTMCVNSLSDLALPATLHVCRDTDGANPRNLIAASGDGNDLEILATRAIIVPGMIDTGTIDFDPPLCLEGVTGNIVVVLDIPSMYAGTGWVPANSGYQLRAAGTTVPGAASGVFVRLTCADFAGQFVAAESLGASFTSQWYVGANGTFSGCSSNCPGDCTRDGTVDSGDLAVVLAAWGMPDTGQGPSYPDADGDGIVGPRDLTVVLAEWGPCD